MNTLADKLHKEINKDVVKCSKRLTTSGRNYDGAQEERRKAEKRLMILAIRLEERGYESQRDEIIEIYRSCNMYNAHDINSCMRTQKSLSKRLPLGDEKYRWMAEKFLRKYNQNQ